MGTDWESVVGNIVSKESLQNLRDKERLELKERKCFLKTMNKYKWEPIQEFRNQIFTSNLTSIFDLINAITEKCFLCEHLSCNRSTDYKLICSEYEIRKKGCGSFLLSICFVNSIVDTQNHELNKRLDFYNVRKQEMLIMNKSFN